MSLLPFISSSFFKAPIVRKSNGGEEPPAAGNRRQRQGIGDGVDFFLLLFFWVRSCPKSRKRSSAPIYIGFLICTVTYVTVRYVFNVT